MRRFWTMLAHYHGKVLNYSELGQSFGLSDVAIRNYIETLAGTFMIRVLAPWHENLGKRLIRRPKIYFRNTGLLHTLLSIQSREDLLSHPILGFSWEGFVLENIVAGNWTCFFSIGVQDGVLRSNIHPHLKERPPWIA